MKSFLTNRHPTAWRRVLYVSFALLALMCVSSESHIGKSAAFLTECSVDTPCEDPAQTCQCVCTIACSTDSDCRDQLAGVELDLDQIRCLPPACGVDENGDELEGAVCDVTCTEDADCAPLSREHRCVAGSCRRPAPTEISSMDPTCPLGSALVDDPAGAYCLALKEVTVAEYTACVEAGDCTVPASGNYFVNGFENHPIQEVTPTDAEDYCASVGGDLPTRAQWELGARGSSDFDYPWGDEAPAVSDVPQRVCAFTTTTTCEVGIFPAGDSESGLSDLSGNVAEWVIDGADYCAIGGSYVDTDPALLASDSCVVSSDPEAFIGFRCVLPRAD